MHARASIQVWGREKSPAVWDILIEGKLDGKSFIQVFFLTASSKDVAVDLARAKFQTLEGEFVDVAEAKRTRNVALRNDEVEVGGRIFFG